MSILRSNITEVSKPYKLSNLFKYFELSSLINQFFILDMTKLFFLIISYTFMIIQLIAVLSTDFTKVKVYGQTDWKINVLILAVLVLVVVILCKKLIREMLTEK